jgi:hypothetical protein
MREGGLFFICWRFCLLIWYLMLILYTRYSHVSESRCLLAPPKFMVDVLGLTWIGMDIWIILFLDLICIFSLVAVWMLSLRFWIDRLRLLWCSYYLLPIARWKKTVCFYLFSLQVRSAIIYILQKREIDSRWSRYFAAASLFIPSYWTSQVICWWFQWRSFRWADSDFTDLQKPMRRQK